MDCRLASRRCGQSPCAAGGTHSDVRDVGAEPVVCLQEAFLGPAGEEAAEGLAAEFGLSGDRFDAQSGVTVAAGEAGGSYQEPAALVALCDRRREARAAVRGRVGGPARTEAGAALEW